jgi:hypothetical protein
LYNYIIEREVFVVGEKDKLIYLELCRKYYLKDEDFKKFVMLHNLRSSIEGVDPWKKLIIEMTP